MDETKKENKMGIEPIKPLLFSMAFPMMLSMLVQALYNTVDSIFVSRIGEEALTAVSIAFPLQNLMIAFSTGAGVGINSLLSRSLGAKEFEEADRAANNGIVLQFLTSLCFTLFGIFGAGAYIRYMTSDPLISRYGTEYLTIVMTFSAGIFLQITFERLLQSTGLTIYSMVSQMTGAIINIILDPILIFGHFGLPKMGIAGAAAATVIGQICSAVIGLILNVRKNKEIHLGGKYLRLEAKTVIEIYRVGIPSIVMSSVGSVMNFFLNKILLGFSATSAAVFGVYFKLLTFIFMPVFGINNGLVPIVAYNLGARKKERIYEAIKTAITWSVAIMFVGLVIFELFPRQLLGLFNASENMIKIGVPAFRIMCLSWIFAGVGVISGSVFQALGNAVYTLITSVIRQLIVLIPVAWALSRVIGLTGVWIAFPIAEFFSFTVCIILMRRILREKVAVL